MAAAESLNFDSEAATHYFFCVLSGVPLALPVSAIAAVVAPRTESETVRRLDTIGCSIVPHQLHIFKEPLDAKFGFVTFFMQQRFPTTDPAEVHRLVLHWIRHDLTAQLESIQVNVALGQPSECYSSVPFSKALRRQCLFLDATKTKDVKKMETFLLSKVNFGNEGLNAHKNKRADTTFSGTEAVPEDVWGVIGSFCVSSLKPKELLWLAREQKGFPSVLVTNRKLSTVSCDLQALGAFLEKALSPMIKVVL